MANALTLTSLTENIFRAKDIVARETVGFIPSVLVNSGSEGVSINGTVNSFETAQPTLNTSYTPAMTIPAADDQTISAKTMTIGQVANVRIPLRGEDILKLNNTAGSQRVIDDMMANAIRKIVNTIEAHCGTVVKNGASRATGTAGTTPFGSNFNIIADARQILQDNGAPDDGQRSVVLSNSAGTKLRQLANIYKVNEAGTSDTLRTGALLNLFGFNIRESAGCASHTAGTGASYLINNVSGEIVGETVLTLDTGSGTILAGDIITHASDTANKYVVASALASNDVTIAAPGLRIAAANNDAVTVGAAYTGNAAFHRNAVELVMRPPAQPYGGDSAIDRMTVSDDRTGLVFEVAIYKGYGMNMLDFTCLYQAKVWKPEFVATILG